MLHDKILQLLPLVTEDNVLIIGCNDINERSAINRLAYLRNYSTKAVSITDRKDNYIYNDGTGYFYFTKVEWNHDDRDDYDYHNTDSGDGLIYCWDQTERREDMMLDDNVIGLDYNAIVIYPAHLKNLEYCKNDKFLARKQKVTRPNRKKIKGIEVTTDEQEIDIINSIYNPLMKFVKIDTILSPK